MDDFMCVTFSFIFTETHRGGRTKKYFVAAIRQWHSWAKGTQYYQQIQAIFFLMFPQEKSWHNTTLTQKTCNNEAQIVSQKWSFRTLDFECDVMSYNIHVPASSGPTLANFVYNLWNWSLISLNTRFILFIPQEMFEQQQLLFLSSRAAATAAHVMSSGQTCHPHHCISLLQVQPHIHQSYTGWWVPTSHKALVSLWAPYQTDLAYQKGLKAIMKNFYRRGRGFWFWYTEGDEVVLNEVKY